MRRNSERIGTKRLGGGVSRGRRFVCGTAAEKAMGEPWTAVSFSQIDRREISTWLGDTTPPRGEFRG